MAKKTAKKTQKEETKDKDAKTPRVTVTSIVLAALSKNPAADTQEVFNALKAAGKGDSRFNKSHLSWYKYQIRKGKFELANGAELPAARKRKVKDESDKSAEGKDKKSKKSAKKSKKD